MFWPLPIVFEFPKLCCQSAIAVVFNIYAGNNATSLATSFCERRTQTPIYSYCESISLIRKVHALHTHPLTCNDNDSSGQGKKVRHLVCLRR